jgi:3-isopropylmalate/(R)-2-methylmalate dehydratase small subunit
VKAFTQHTGIVAPFDQANIDTDAIVPKQYLKSISKFGYGEWLFDDARYLDPGEVGTDISTRRLNPDFVLNQERYQGASILLARDNFGCGSSREHAVWALRDFGFQVVIAPSFADIFYNNCFKNGLLPLVLDPDVIDMLMNLVRETQGFELMVDLVSQELRLGTEAWSFEIDEGRKKNLLQGKDEISLTLENAEKITYFEQRLFEKEPWLESV